MNNHKLKVGCLSLAVIHFLIASVRHNEHEDWAYSAFACGAFMLMAIYLQTGPAKEQQ